MSSAAPRSTSASSKHKPLRGRPRRLLGAGAIALSALWLAGCKLPLEPDAGTGAGSARIEVQRIPGIAELRLDLQAAAQDQPLPDYESVLVTVHSPSTMTSPRVATLTAAEFAAIRSVNGPLFTRLPAASDMTVRAYLRGPDEALLASAESRDLTFTKGPNRFAVPLTPRTAEAKVLRASDGIDVSDGVVIKGVAIDLATGIPDDFPGVAKVEIGIDGPAYQGGPSTLASFPAPRLLHFTWRPAQASGDYHPNRLGRGRDKQSFTLTARAIDPFGNMAGVTRLPLAIVGTAFVDVGIDP